MSQHSVRTLHADFSATVPAPGDPAMNPPEFPSHAHPWAQLQPHGWQWPCPAGMSVLEAALAHGVELPSSCRNGTCRACRCRLVAGEVRFRIDWPGLSAEEKAEGWILPCVALARTDLALELPPDVG